ncbi:hypothetical protein BAE44_0025414, partial [Dichanthelium oligosanthes]
LINYEDFVNSTIEQYWPSYLEIAHVQYYDEAVVFMFIAYCDSSKPYEPIAEWHSNVQNQPQNNKEDEKDRYLCNPLP